MDPVAREDALTSVYPRDIHDMGVAAPHSSHSHHRIFDGEPLGDDIDPELTRKMNVLQDIEEQLFSKKAALIIETIKMMKKKLTSDSKDATLRDRVHTILKERHSLNFLSKCKTYASPTESDDSPSHSTEQLEEHPLKLRVEALMRHRFSDPDGFTSNKPAPNCEMATTSASQPPLSQSIGSEMQRENVSNKGFERFLSLLNKGVDMDLLSRVVSDNSEDFHLGEQLLNSQHSGAGDDSDRPLFGESLQCNGEPQLPKNGGERTALSTGEEHPRPRPSLPDDDKNGKGKRDRSLGRTSGCQSPLAVEETKKDGKEMVQVDERCEQLQNILNTLGLSLEIEDLSKLTDRTQERLYGKKNPREPVEQQGQVTTSGCRKLDMKSTSSCSSSPSRSRRHSPSSGQLSRSRKPQDPHERDTLFACGGARKSQEKLPLSSTSQDDTQVRKTVGTDKVANVLNGIPAAHSYCDPAPSFALPDGSFPHFSHYHSSYSHGTNSDWTGTPGASVTPYYPSRYADSTDTCDSRGTIPSGKRRPRFIQDVPLENPDLSTSEGQLGSVSRPRYLQVVKRKPQMWGAKSLSNGELIKEDKTKRLQLIEEQARDVQTLRAHRQTKASGGKKAGRKDGSKKRRTPTEEEIKANWRKKLEAFNQMSKNKSRAQPSPCPDTQMYDVGL